MDSILRFFLVLNIVPSYLRASHFPDFTCFQSYERKGMEIHEKLCNKRVRNPLNRSPCYKACILERLGFITPPDIYDTGSMEFQIMKPDNDTHLAELMQVIYGEQEARDLAKKIIGTCGDIMRQIINQQKKNCEDWDPIYQCISGNVCMEEKLYPDMSCHDEYRSFPFRRERNICIRRIALPTTHECLKGCMLSQLGIYVYDIDEDNPFPKMGSMEGEYYYYNLLYNFIDGLSGNRELAESLVRNVCLKCNETFIRIVNEEKRPCEDWKELYDCVEKYLQCADIDPNVVEETKTAAEVFRPPDPLGGPAATKEIILPPAPPPAPNTPDAAATARRKRFTKWEENENWEHPLMRFQ